MSVLSKAGKEKISNGMSPRVVAVVPAAGQGKRLGSKTRKPFVLLRNKPLVTYALAALEKSGVIDGIIIASERSSIKDFEALVRKFNFKKVIDIVVGGKTRFESVRNCLIRVGDSFDIVLIHDAARPFIDQDMIKDSVELAERFGGCIVAVPESDTVKLVDKLFIKKTLDRNRIYRAQTPQTFKVSLIKKAYARKSGQGITDDAMLVERFDSKVKILEGTYRNIKITTSEDLKLAETLL